MTTNVLKSFAKINLALHVTGKLTNLHKIESIVKFIDLYDTISINEINKNGIKVYGPFASDSFFGSKLYKSYDAIIASYHDQGLIPFKTLTFGNGVNFTAGLDKVRTSPDHGTAYDIAGKNLADPNSFKSAVLQAINILKSRGKI